KTLGKLNRLAARSSDYIVVPSHDYADQSSVLRSYRSKLRVVTPLVDIGRPAEPGLDLADNGNGQDGPVIAMAARIAPEKGIEYLLKALPDLIRDYPGLRLAMTGERRPSLGCEAYFRRIEPMLDRYQDHIEFAGVLDRSELPAFMAGADVLVVPSIDAREAFGMVQVEAMLCGTPVVASDLPGMREPVSRTGMGVLVPTHDPAALANGIRSVLSDPPRFSCSREEIAQIYDARAALDTYEHLLREAIRRSSR
ncbi:MAG TPA: glycosyltransferase family 4 protein, partial [Chloroflexota bacterium]|nr:glycosyltransferase family 4 protein [Chloroflexota bacterium]